MKLRTGGLAETLERLAPFLTIAVVVMVGWFWFIQPRFASYLRARTDVASLEERVRTMQQVSAHTLPQPPAGLERTQREFEARVSADDQVATVAQALAKAVIASAPPGRLRSFVIETGDRSSPAARAGAGDWVRESAGGGPDGADPRLALFPYEVSYTPLRVTFESTFEAAGNVLWQLRDLPTTVEVRSAALTRGLPLMKTELVVRVLQRGSPIEAAPAAEQPLLGVVGPPRSGAVPLDPLTIPAPPPIDAASSPSWRRDPFLFGAETRVVARPVLQPPTQAQAPVLPTVRTILYSASRRLAIVDGRIVGVGDAVGGYTVADIEKDAVVFTAPSSGRLRVPVHARASDTVSR